MRSWLASAGVVLAVLASCSESGKVTPGGSAGRAGRAGGDAGEGGEAGGESGGKGSGGRAGSNGKGGAGGKAGGAAGGRAATGGSGGGAGDDPGAGGMLGEPGSLLPSHGKGTRLDVKELRAADMPPVFVTFFDTELGMDCRFVAASDGTMRCLPPYTPRVPIRATEMFLDDTCTEPVAVGDPTCVAAEDTWITEITPASEPCEQGTEHVYRATLLADGLPVYSNAGGNCDEAGTTGAIYHHFSIAEADPGDFVEGKLDIVETPTRLSVQRVVAEDGAFRTLGLADPTVMRECRVFGEGPAGAVCVPAPAFSGRDYRASDAECNVPLSLASCSVPLTVIDVVDRDDFTVFEAGPLYTGTVYGGIGTCAEVTGDEGPLYEIGDPIPRGDLPSVTSAYEGSGRLRHLVFSDAAGTELAAGAVSGSAIASEGGLFDTELDAACSIRRYTDLAEYCIPDDITTESPNNLYYSDADCTEQVAVCGDRGCPRDLAMLAGNGEGAVCGVIPDFVSVLTLGDPVALDEIYIWYGGRPAGMECDGPFPTDGYGVIREIAGETDPSAFVKLLPAGG